MSCDDCAQTVANYNAMEQRWRDALARERRLREALELIEQGRFDGALGVSQVGGLMAVARAALADQPEADEASA